MQQLTVPSTACSQTMRPNMTKASFIYGLYFFLTACVITRWKRAGYGSDRIVSQKGTIIMCGNRHFAGALFIKANPSSVGDTSSFF